MNLESRIRALEEHLATKHTTITLKDGSTKRIPGDDLLGLLCAAMTCVYEWSLTHPWGTAIPVAEFAKADLVLADIMESIETHNEDSVISIIRNLQLEKENQNV